jgi:hypothetical protein
MGDVATLHEQAGSRADQGQDDQTADEKEHQLPDSDAASVVPLRPLQVAQRREGHTAGLMPLEEVQEQRNPHRQTRQQEEGVQS